MHSHKWRCGRQEAMSRVLLAFLLRMLPTSLEFVHARGEVSNVDRIFVLLDLLKRVTLPVRMARMPRLLSHMLDPDCPLLLRQVCCRMFAHPCSTNTIPALTQPFKGSLALCPCQTTGDRQNSASRAQRLQAWLKGAEAKRTHVETAASHMVNVGKRQSCAAQLATLVPAVHASTRQQ